MKRQAPEAVVFDMDGVLVDSARIHARAWKEAFDEFLAKRGRPDGFDLSDDYRQYVDGRPRYEGVASFLASRDIDLPVGEPSDDPGLDTISALGNLKNEVFHRLVDAEGVEPLPGVEGLLASLRDDQTPLAVVTSSRNMDRILPEGIARQVDVALGGKDLDELQIPGKPEPDMFIAAVKCLGLSPGVAAVVEDSPAGVRAGRRGGFSLVIGVDPEHQSLLMADLADIVVRGVSELPPRLPSWSDRLTPPSSALDNVATIRRLLGSGRDDEPSSLYIGDDEDELLAVRQRDGVGLLVDPEPSAMTWADFSVPDQERGAEVRARLARTDPEPAE